ncbi:hypothetical protein TSUD_23910 [Trifolium subterraneum]|uniref:Uncharacterized protein n=1 Tax=Trifolium subterraneum TaxID=3900 RepID=A0A2Z6MLK9_TRISU|nr:hypothetical protein TSUD_23910 [Trifolium subterraneum]
MECDWAKKKRTKISNQSHLSEQIYAGFRVGSRCYNQIDFSKSTTALSGHNKNWNSPSNNALTLNVDDSRWGISLRGMEVVLEL